MTDTTACLIWGTPAGIHADDFDRDTFLVRDSDRAGGSYAVTLEAYYSVQSLDDSTKAKLTTWLIDESLQGNQAGVITRTIIDNARRASPLTIEDRANRLLRFFAHRSQVAGERVDIDLVSDRFNELGQFQSPQEVPTAIRSLRQAMAWSESTQVGEIVFLLNYLTERRWVTSESGTRSAFATVTVTGYAQIEDSRVNAGQHQAFVAMWFDEQVEDAFEHGIRPAIEEAGYSAMRIDRKEHINRIDDEIIAEIRRSRFLVADFSQGADGARGGVYFEAGFALGLDIPVIYTCRSSDFKKLSFDTRQYNHISWESPGELRIALRNRILAVIGEGPNTNPDTA